MRADPVLLVRRLTPTATRHLERAVALTAASHHVEVSPEQFLSILLDDEGDARALFDERARAEARADLARALTRMRTGGARPILSELLVRWLEDAWLLASLRRSETSLRTGALLVAAVDAPERYFSVAPSLPPLTLEHRARSLAETPEDSEARERVATGRSETGALGRFTTSVTARARAGGLDPVLGRDMEIRTMIDILCRRRKNNPLLVGEPGVGKSALVEGLALTIASGSAPEPLRTTEILALDLGLLAAGASAAGELEARLTSVIREVKESATPIVLFIDEAHTLVGGAARGGVDVANLLKPPLARGELRTIAATTWAEYKRYFEKDAALDRRFQPVKVDEPTEATALAMMRGLRATYEAAHGVVVRDDALEAAVRLSSRFLPGRQLPDKCVDLLDTTATRVRVSQSAPPLALVRLDADLTSLRRTQEAQARDRVDGIDDGAIDPTLATRIAALTGERVELEARLVAQRAALERVLGARRSLEAARGEASVRRDREIELRVARAAFQHAVGERPLLAAEVDGDAIAATLESWTGIPVGALRRSQTDTLLRLESELDQRVLGQTEAARRIAEGLRIAHAGLRRAEAPLGVFLLVGPSGVGKTETAHALAALLFGGERSLTSINLSEYQEKHTVSRLLGSPPGYVGYGEGGKLTEAVRQTPHSVVLLDECEKADPDVMNVFYELFDRGTLTDGEGRRIDFKNTVILLTSNLGSDLVTKLHASGAPTAADLEEALRPTLSARFAPALLARMTVVPYAPLSDETLRAIATAELERVASRVLDAHGVQLRFADTLVARLVAECTHGDAGVRHLRAVLERHVLAPLAPELLARAHGHAASRTVAVDLSQQGDRALTTCWA